MSIGIHLDVSSDLPMIFQGGWGEIFSPPAQKRGPKKVPKCPRDRRLVFGHKICRAIHMRNHVCSKLWSLWHFSTLLNYDFLLRWFDHKKTVYTCVGTELLPHKPLTTEFFWWDVPHFRASFNRKDVALSLLQGLIVHRGSQDPFYLH